MPLTRKDYRVFSAIINHHLQIMCDIMQEDNPNFNRSKFIAACIPKQPKG